jgi:hypothetical protein
MNKHEVIMAIGLAIHLRESHRVSSMASVEETVKKLSDFGIFSNRQLANIAKGSISHSHIAKLTNKTAKSGGRLNPADLESVRDLMLQADAGRIDWELVKLTVRRGTSQNLLSKLTGISKSQINRKIAESI